MSADVTPSFEYAKASVSVPVERETAARWKGIFSASAAAIMKRS
jgi:hypothetical protein